MNNDEINDSEEEASLRPVSELGTLENGIFTYHEPVTLPSGKIIEKIDLRCMVLEEGIRPEDVIEAIANAFWDGSAEQESFPVREDDVLPLLMDGPVSPN